jgi:hypothetical protein
MFDYDYQNLIRLMERRSFITRLSLLVALSLIPQIHFVNQITQALWHHAGAHLQLITLGILALLVVYIIYLEFLIRRRHYALKQIERYYKRKAPDKLARSLFFEDEAINYLNINESTDLYMTEKPKRKRSQ